MQDMTLGPIHLSGPRGHGALGWQLLRDPITAMRQNHAEHGPLIVISDLLPFTRSVKLATLGLPLILAAAPAFNNEVLSNPVVWRPVGLFRGRSEKLGGATLGRRARAHEWSAPCALPASHKRRRCAKPASRRRATG